MLTDRKVPVLLVSCPACTHNNIRPVKPEDNGTFMVLKNGPAQPEATLGNLEELGRTLVVWGVFLDGHEDVQQDKVLSKACCGPIAASQGNTTNQYQRLRNPHSS